MQLRARPLWRIFRLGALAFLATGTVCVLLRGGSAGLGRSFSLLNTAGDDEAARLAEVKDLRNAHDTQIPFLLPPCIAFFASIVYGLTSFGEAITFMIGWSVSGALGFLGSDFSFAKGVLYSNMINLLAIPVTIWISRAEIRPTIWWGLYCSVMLFTFEADGIHVLLFDHTGAARHLIAFVFALFAFWRANSAAHDFGRAREVASSPEPMWKETDASGHAAYTLDEHETIVLDSRERWTAHWSFVEKILNEYPALRRAYDTAFPRIYESNKTIETALLILSAAFMLSGFMVGLASTGGAPMMVAFIWLKLSKGAIRALRNISGFFAIYIWLTLFSRHNHGLHMWSTAQEWPTFVALIVAGTLGSSVGAWLRTYISRDHLLFCFYFLIWGDAALLLDVFGSSAQPLVAPSTMFIATVVLSASVAVCYFQPDAIDALLQKSDEMASILSPRDKNVDIPLNSHEREQLIGHIEALKAAGRLSKEQEDALNAAVEQRDPRTAQALRLGGRDDDAHSAVQDALLSLARRAASERK
jgi:hypothetical protein